MSELIFINVKPIERPIQSIISDTSASLALDYEKITGNDFRFKFRLIIPLDNLRATKVLHGYYYTVTKEPNIIDLTEFFTHLISETIQKEKIRINISQEFLYELVRKIFFATRN